MSNQTDFLSIMNGVRLSGGAHRKAGAEMCAMEMVAWLEGEPHSDKPQCACPVIGRFVIGINDHMRDGERDQLLPFLPRIVGTRSTREIEARRGQYLAWKALTVFAPMALDARGFIEHMNTMRVIPMPATRNDWLVARQIAAAAAAAAADAADDADDDAADDAAAYAADAAAYAAYAAYAADDAAAYAADAAAYAAYAAADAAAARQSVITAWLGVLDGVLSIGPSGAGFTRPLPAPGEAARRLGMVTA